MCLWTVKDGKIIGFDDRDDIQIEINASDMDLSMDKHYFGHKY